MRVALIFDHKVRPDTTGVYCRRALGQLVDVEHFLPTDLARIPRHGFDLYLNIDDGLEYYLPADLKPCAWWAIDTHLNYQYCRDRARDFDFVFTAQRDAADRFIGEGLSDTCWLPLACDPEFHRKHDVAKEFDTCFVGHVFDGPRADLLRLLQQHFPNSFVGQRFFDEMAQTYSSSRTVFNRSIRNDINMRVFEALACGSLLLTNDLTENGQDGLAQDGVHLATYGGPEELLDKLRFYLARENTREAIAAAGRAFALDRHTYQHRMAALLGYVEQKLATTTVPVAVASGAAELPTSPADAIAEHFPPNADRILVAGPDTSELTLGLRARRPGAEVTDFTVRDGRLTGSIFDRPPPDGGFDLIVAAGVLELLDKPQAWLEAARNQLKPDGLLLATVPNLRHHGIVRSLLDGNWTHGPGGVAGVAQRRFFTRREIEKLFYRSGFELRSCLALPSSGYAAWVRAGRPQNLQAGALNIAGLDPVDAADFHTEQFLATAAPLARTDRGVTSIVILTHNELAYTRQCVESILAFTDEKFELVFVDNGSTDGTVNYLRSLPDAAVIANPENRGFPAGCNQGIRAAKGAQILLLNNDTVVTTGWLDKLLGALETDPRIGVVGPSSNNVSGEQQIAVTYDDLTGLDGFAWELGKTNAGQTADTDRLVGFCLLVRRAVIESIGLLDERFGIGCFEDDDYCKRARLAGYRVVHAKDAFVHHFGGRTFVATGVDYSALIRQNQARFEEKWAADSAAVVAAPVTPPAPDLPAYACRAESGGLRLVHRAVELSLCMIVRNNARTIRACLESIRPFVDEMVVVDTGSTDDTPSIATELGARLFYFPWCDDFSAARNESVRKARGRWIFWMDSDDTISPACGQRLRELIGGAAAEVLGFTVDVHCPGRADRADEVTIVTHVKLFRNRPDLRFEHRIHEQILPAIIRAGGPPDSSIRQTDVFVTHSGYDHSPAGQAHKLERDLRILHRELIERPDHPFTLFNLGMTYTDVRRCDEAIEYLTRCIQHSGETDSHVRKAFAYLASCQQALSRLDLAWQACEEGLRRFPLDAELRFRRAMLLHQQNRFDEAIAAYLDLLSCHEPEHFRSVVEGVDGFLARHNLAVVYEEAGDLPRAEEQLRVLVSGQPRYRPGWRKLGQVLVLQDKTDEAADLAGQLLQDRLLHREGHLIRGRVFASRGDKTAAQSDWGLLVQDKSTDTDLLEEAARLLHEQIGPAAALAAHEEILRRIPDHASAHNNLGQSCLAAGEPERAVACHLQSLRLRPAWPPTLVQLGHALEAVGRHAEAAQAWEEASRLSRETQDFCSRQELI